jgi:hypothetical protein
MDQLISCDVNFRGGEMEVQSSGGSIEVLMEKVLSVNILSSDYFKSCTGS